VAENRALIFGLEIKRWQFSSNYHSNQKGIALAKTYYQKYIANKIENGWIRVSLPTEALLGEEFAFSDLIHWCKAFDLNLTIDYDHSARTTEHGFLIDFWFRDKEKAMLFKLTFV
jgi:hypothetical protein